MRRLLALAGVLAVVVSAGTARPSSAQYGGGGTDTTLATTTTTEATPTTTEAPPPDDNRVEGDVSPDETTPGGTVTFTAPAGSFAPGAPLTVFLVRSVDGSQARQLGPATADGGGGVSTPVTIPTDTPNGVYYVYLTGLGPDGEERIAIAPLVVSGGITAAGTGGPVPGLPAPAPVQALQQPASQEAEAIQAAAGGARLEIVGDDLVPRGGPAGAGRSAGVALSGAEIGTAVAAGVVLLLVGLGLVSLRRRPREVRP